MINKNDYSPGFYKIYNELDQMEKKFGSEIIKTLAAKLILNFIWFRWHELKEELIKKFNGD